MLRIGLPPAALQCVICDEVFELVEELNKALEGLIEASISVAICRQPCRSPVGAMSMSSKRGEGKEPELLSQREWHDDTVSPEKGILRCQILDWRLILLVASR